ncbi:hypothetical protein [Caballeronia sp. dw_276]|uniref:hypothetical protein n=1 Tax=Caballeronia sp. dw_276 TaxID=2719795 RepID=UPI001BD25721|nr:hypothetical protein [Caballeronia sp. dw_276]
MPNAIAINPAVWAVLAELSGSYAHASTRRSTIGITAVMEIWATRINRVFTAAISWLHEFILPLVHQRCKRRNFLYGENRKVLILNNRSLISALPHTRSWCAPPLDEQRSTHKVEMRETIERKATD